MGIVSAGGRSVLARGANYENPGRPHRLLRQSGQLFQKALLGSVHRHSNNNPAERKNAKVACTRHAAQSVQRQVSEKGSAER